MLIKLSCFNMQLKDISFNDLILVDKIYVPVDKLEILNRIKKVYNQLNIK